jgi:3-oxoacyl-(acyl-carrier-protein) synthase
VSRRVVVITGVGAMSPAGVGAQALLDLLRAGGSAVRVQPELDGPTAAPVASTARPACSRRRLRRRGATRAFPTSRRTAPATP